MPGLAANRAESAHLPEQPLHGFKSVAQIGRKETSSLFAKILKYSARFEDREGGAAIGRIVVRNYRNLASVGSREVRGIAVLALAHHNPNKLMLQTHLFQGDRNLVDIRTSHEVQADHRFSFPRL